MAVGDWNNRRWIEASEIILFARHIFYHRVKIMKYIVTACHEEANPRLPLLQRESTTMLRPSLIPTVVLVQGARDPLPANACFQSLTLCTLNRSAPFSHPLVVSTCIVVVHVTFDYLLC